MKFTSKLCIAILTTVLFIACSSEDGEDGINGINGIDGIDGADGADGEQGETGTANVIYSDWIQTNFINPNPAPTNIMGLATFSEGEINTVADVVLVYGGNNLNGEFEIHQLPYIRIGNVQFTFGLFGSDGTETGSTFLQVRTNTFDGTNATFQFFDSYRYVIIPGGNPVTGKSSVDYSKMSYKEVMAHFNIPE